MPPPYSVSILNQMGQIICTMKQLSCWGLLHRLEQWGDDFSLIIFNWKDPLNGDWRYQFSRDALTLARVTHATQRHFKTCAGQWLWHSWQSGCFQRPEIRGSNPIISNFLYWAYLMITVVKTKIIRINLTRVKCLRQFPDQSRSNVIFSCGNEKWSEKDGQKQMRKSWERWRRRHWFKKDLVTKISRKMGEIH